MNLGRRGLDRIETEGAMGEGKPACLDGGFGWLKTRAYAPRFVVCRNDRKDCGDAWFIPPFYLKG